MLCERCAVWEILEGDLRCSWCGLDQFGLDVKTNLRLYVYPENPSANKGVTYRSVLRNLSRSRLTVSCEATPDWLLVSPPRTSVVEPGKSLDLALSADIQKLGGVTIREGTIVLAIAIANQESESRFDPVKVKVEVWPLPQINIKPLTVFSGSPSGRAEVDMEVWSPISIESVTFDPPYLLFDEPGMELDVDDQHHLPVRLNLPGLIGSSTHSVSFSIKVVGLPEPIVGQFEMLVRKSAALKVVESGDSASLGHEILAGSEEHIDLALANNGDQVLRIDGVQIVNKDAVKQLAVHADKESLVIQPGQEERLRLKVTTAPDATTANCWFEIIFSSNDPDTRHNTYNLWLRVVDEEYADFIALDFGTTDSAVAILDSKGSQHMNVLLQPGLRDTKIYSNIFFKSYVAEREMPYAWCIGREARQLGTQTENRGRFIKAIKTKVGTGHREVIPFGKKGFDCTLEPEEIITFIMMDLLGRTRSVLRKRPTRFILSVPTRFSLRRKEMLREALRRAAESVSLNLNAIEMVDESLAAGLFYFLMRGPRDEYIRSKESYTAMILDFGGGTTDTTVFRVRQRRQNDGSVQVDDIEVIGASGDATLGGEEISLEIAELLAERFLGRRVDPRDDSSEIRKLEDEAEAVKLAVSELLRIERLTETVSIEDVVEKETDALKSHLEYLRIGHAYGDDGELRRLVEAYLEDDSFELPVESNDFIGQAVKIKPQEVVQIFERKLSKLKEELESVLRRINQMPVDVLLLAGQSSLFPTVKEVFDGLATYVDFVKDPSDRLVLKECVSLGALYYSFYLSGDLNLTITGAERIWTRVGRPRFMPGTGKIGFQELIPWGSEPPRESEPFKLTKARDVSAGDILEFTVEENLSMGEAMKKAPLGAYGLKLQDASPSDYTCKLKVSSKGEIEAFCLVKDEWQKMEFKL